MFEAIDRHFVFVAWNKKSQKKKSGIVIYILNAKWKIYIYIHLGQIIGLYHITTELVKSFVYQLVDHLEMPTDSR